MTKLSVNINKIATIRNARGGNIPNVVEAAINCENYGANGITVHPRPDERHITYNDVYELSKAVKTEFNIEGNPIDKFVDLVLKVKPTQVTLVPDSEDAITSNQGWNTIKYYSFLKDINQEFKKYNIRTSIFIDPKPVMVEGAAKCGVDRVELYTESYSTGYNFNKYLAIEPFILTAKVANDVSLELNAGHDLNLENLNFFIKKIPLIKEVSIGHALIADALYFGLEKTIKKYLRELVI